MPGKFLVFSDELSTHFSQFSGCAIQDMLMALCVVRVLSLRLSGILRAEDGFSNTRAQTSAIKYKHVPFNLKIEIGDRKCGLKKETS